MIHIAEEKNYENKIKEWLESNGIYPLGCPIQVIKHPPIGYYVKRWGGGLYVKSGLPDMQIVVHGKCIEIEIKASKGKPSLLQEIICKQINDSGGCARIVYPKDFESLKILIKEYIGNGK